MMAILMREYNQPYSEIKKMNVEDAIFLISLHEMIQKKIEKEMKHLKVKKKW
ncbi:MAG: hypothetical protein ACTSUK_03900 [Promethearchaeota archaeon]